MTKTVQIAHNAVTAKLINPPYEARLEAQRILSYRVDGHEHMSAFKSGTWDGRSTFYEWSNDTFPRGFVSIVYHALTKAGFRVQIVKKPYPEPLGPAYPVVDSFGEDPRYDYQREVPEKLVKHGQIIAQVATGGGKSRIAKLCVARINRPTLFLTTRGVLMYQMARGFKSLDKRVAILGDGNLEISREITCGMVQTIMAWLKEPDPASPPEKQRKQLMRREKMIQALSSFEFVILEEAHEASGNSYYEILRHCKNAHYRLALTATPLMKDSEEANMRLVGSSGAIAIRVSEELLIERGILATPYFKFVKLKEHPSKLYRSTPYLRAVELGIVNNEVRNKHIVAEAVRASRYGLSIMVLVARKEHGSKLEAMMVKAGLKARFILGENDQDERDHALKQLGSGEINVLIGTTILDVGVDVPAVGMVILAGGGKAEVALRQRIGRGLREKKNGLPNIAFVVDFTDDLNTHLKMHAKARQHIIATTPGFNRIVEDFDFKALGLSKAA
ncbi:DEAD/DEAH box helicase [Methyloversatilis sp.]|uniref:DEAD/DEAH box helicase n=1 Tax=Methyloversatilis sp. TaxID=2569862 RepID=UPI0035AFD16C